MATITAGDFRNGKTFEYEGKIMTVVEYQHVKPGKGAAFVRTKMKNVVTGAVTENTVCKVLSYKGSVFGLECPNFMDLEVTETEPGLAGNTATNTLKPATVETGAEVKVPLFINIGDKISIDTRTGEYIGRAK